MKELFLKTINRAIQKQATDIHMTLKKELIIKFRIYGDLVHYDKISFEIGNKLMNYIKYSSSINTNLKLVPQTGEMMIYLSKRKYHLRVSFLPSPNFESIVIRILNNHKKLTISEITHQEDLREYYQQLIHKTSGLFLISGPTGSGKSTTLYTLIDEISQSNQKNIITIEDPIEMKKDYCLQVQLNEQLGITYHQTLKQILRHDPDIIMIGEIRDEKTAKIAITCALTGHLVLTTIHSSNAFLALKRLLNLGVSEADIEDVLIGSVSQRMKYDFSRKEVIVLSELMTKRHIWQYLNNGILDYFTFENEIEKLKERGYNMEMFETEFYEN